MSIVVTSVVDVKAVKNRIYAQAVLRDIRTSVNQTKRALRSVENTKGGTSNITNYSMLMEKLGSIDELSERLSGILSDDDALRATEESKIVDSLLSEIGPAAKEKIVSLQRLTTSFGNGRALSAWANATEHRRLFVQHSFSLCTIEKGIKRCLHDLERLRNFTGVSRDGSAIAAAAAIPAPQTQDPAQIQIQVQTSAQTSKQKPPRPLPTPTPSSLSPSPSHAETKSASRRGRFPKLKIPGFSKKKGGMVAVVAVAEEEEDGEGEEKEEEAADAAADDRTSSPARRVRTPRSQQTTGSFALVQTPHPIVASREDDEGGDGWDQAKVRLLLRIFNLKQNIIRMNSEKNANRDILRSVLSLQEARGLLQATSARRTPRQDGSESSSSSSSSSGAACDEASRARLEEIRRLSVLPAEADLLRTMNKYSTLQSRERVSEGDIGDLTDEELDILIENYRGSSEVEIIDLVRDDWEDLRTGSRAFHLLPSEYMCDYEDMHRMLDDQFKCFAEQDRGQNLRVFNEVLSMLSSHDESYSLLSLEKKYEALDAWIAGSSSSSC